MADARAAIGGAMRIARGDLWGAIARRTGSARAVGALEPIETETLPAREGGIPFVVRVASALTARRRRLDARSDRHNPFLPADPELVVGTIGEAHLCVLNKFPVIEHHALIVTRDYQDQEAPLERSDFEALWSCLREGGLAFYNAGAAAGASERHRHLQLVPTPIGEPPLATPLDAVQPDAHFDAGIGRIASLPFLHGIGRLRAIANQSPAEAAEPLLGLYRQLARAFGCHRHGQPYNLLVCRDWMMIVPRARGQWRGISVNGLGFAGALVVPGRTELDVVRREGPLRVLAHVAVPATPH
ncbi:MAG: phosphorylase [Deltaproteobacteria bacterium]|nr:MAG: phosphorylase [Deltaproteobacteria bacterium]